MKYQILTGDNRQVLPTIASNSIDAIVTDPPYGIDFLGKSWDATTGALETYQECLRVLKPGGHILAFSAARTYHHLAVTLEQAGFEIRDQIMWIYSSGFPKSQDIGRSIQRGIKNSEYYTKEEWEKLKGYTNMPTKTMGHNDTNDGQTDAGLSGKVVKITDPEAQKWAGWGTQLKPAHEPIVLARKPIKLSIAKNCQQWGVGALNIDATRVGDEVITTVIKRNDENSLWYGKRADDQNLPKEVDRQDNVGRFPSNVIGEIPDYQKYFYCPKVSRKERHIGFDNVESMDNIMKEIGAYFCDENGNAFIPQSNDPYMIYVPGLGKIYPHGLKHEVDKIRKANGTIANVGNNHPTIKPVELMKYLIRLITPPGGTVLDPFAGSGSTGMAAVELDCEFTGIEQDPAYVAIAHKRIQAWAQPHNNYDQLFVTENNI